MTLVESPSEEENHLPATLRQSAPLTYTKMSGNKVFTKESKWRKSIYYIFLNNIDKCFTLFDQQTFNKPVVAVKVLYKELKILLNHQKYNLQVILLGLKYCTKEEIHQEYNSGLTNSQQWSKMPIIQVRKES